VPPAPAAPGPETPPQKLVNPAPLTLTKDVATIFDTELPTEPI
jgi:hypothetical protein